MSGSVSGGSQKGNQNQSGTNDTTYTGTTTPNPTPDWSNISTYLKDNINSNGGLTPDQQASINYFSGKMDGTNPLQAGITKANSVLGAYAPGSHDAYQVGSTTPISADQVKAQQGSAFMDSYKNPYLDQVLDSSLADYDTGVSRAGNAFRAGSIAGGSTGGAYGSNPVGAGVLAGEAARGRGTLSSGIRSDAFNTAAGYGQTDASRFLQGDVANQGANLQASAYNQNDQTQRDTANMASKYTNDQQSLGAVRDWVNNLGTADAAGNNASTSVYNMSGGGLNNLGSFLASQVPGFGQDVSGSSHTDSTGNSSSSGSSKGGGGGGKLI